VGGSAQYDLAIVRAETAAVKAINENIKPVTLASEYFVGETAIAVGNPNGEGLSVSEGIVSIDNEYISLNVDDTDRLYRSIRIDTPLYSGNSGGGLFNSKGELIGIANAGKKTDQNINFAVPVQIVRAVTQNIMHYHSDGKDDTNGVYRLTLGVTVASKNSRYIYDGESGYGRIQEDITVLETAENSISARMGLQKDDIIKAIVINGTRYHLDRYFHIADYLLSLTENTTFYFIYERDGEEKNTFEYCVTATDLAQIV
jgi:serine protease Do